MLAANANGDGGFAVDLLWIPRRRAAQAAEGAAALAAAEALRAATTGAGDLPAARVRTATVAVQTPVSLAQQILSADAPDGARLDGVPVYRGDTVLLTAQTDPRENGLWTYGAGVGATPAVALFPGLPVRVARGAVAGGWLFACTAYNATTGAAVLLPVYGPPPTKAQVDALGVDAATVAGRPPEALGKDIVSTGGDMSLVSSGAGSGSLAPYALRGLSAGSGVRLLPSATDITITSGTGGVVCALRPTDVVATAGCFRIETQRPCALPPPARGAWPAEWDPVCVPVLWYRAAAGEEPTPPTATPSSCSTACQRGRPRPSGSPSRPPWCGPRERRPRRRPR